MRFAIKNEIPCTENTEYLIFLKKRKNKLSIVKFLLLKEIVLWNIPFGWGVEPHCNIINGTLAVAFSTDFI